MTVLYVAVCCCVLLCVDVCCCVLQLYIQSVCSMTHKGLAKSVHDSTVSCCVLLCVAMCCSVLLYDAVCCGVPETMCVT